MEIGIFLFPKYSEFEAEILGFHLVHKKVLLLVKPWGMRMQWEHCTF